MAPFAMLSGAGRLMPRVAKKTAAVHVGTRSQNGTSSERNVGRKAQCQPTSQVIAVATARSSASFQGEPPPSANAGSRTICVRSASTAITRAARTLPGDGTEGRRGSSAMPGSLWHIRELLFQGSDLILGALAWRKLLGFPKRSLDRLSSCRQVLLGRIDVGAAVPDQNLPRSVGFGKRPIRSGERVVVALHGFVCYSEARGRVVVVGEISLRFFEH